MVLSALGANDLAERLDVALQKIFLGLRREIRWVGPARVGQPEDEHVVLRLTPFRTTQTSPKSTSASAPGACSCGTNTST